MWAIQDHVSIYIQIDPFEFRVNYRLTSKIRRTIYYFSSDPEIKMQLHLAWSHCDMYIQYFTNQNFKHEQTIWNLGVDRPEGEGASFRSGPDSGACFSTGKNSGWSHFRSCTKSGGSFMTGTKSRWPSFQNLQLTIKKKTKTKTNKQKRSCCFMGWGQVPLALSPVPHLQVYWQLKTCV